MATGMDASSTMARTRVDRVTVSGQARPSAEAGQLLTSQVGPQTNTGEEVASAVLLRDGQPLCTWDLTLTSQRPAAYSHLSWFTFSVERPGGAPPFFLTSSPPLHADAHSITVSPLCGGLVPPPGAVCLPPVKDLLLSPALRLDQPPVLLPASQRLHLHPGSAGGFPPKPSLGVLPSERRCPYTSSPVQTSLDISHQVSPLLLSPSTSDRSTGMPGPWPYCQHKHSFMGFHFCSVSNSLPQCEERQSNGRAWISDGSQHYSVAGSSRPSGGPGSVKACRPSEPPRQKLRRFLLTSSTASPHSFCARSTQKSFALGLRGWAGGKRERSVHCTALPRR